MGRFSPTVKPTAAPTGLGSLAQALQSGLAGYQGAQDRQEAQRSRQFTQDIQRGNALRQGVTVDTPAPAETFGSAFSRALSGAPEPTPRAVVPGAFVPQEARFESTDPITGQPKLPIRQSGNVTYDPNLDVERTGATALARGMAGNQVDVAKRNDLRNEFGTSVVSKGGSLAGAGDLGVIRSYESKQPSPVQFTPANAGNQAGVFNKETQTWSPLEGTNAVPRATGTGGTGGMGRFAQKSLEDVNKMLFGLQSLEQSIQSTPGLGLKQFLPIPIKDRTDPGGVRIAALIAAEMSNIRRGYYGTALSKTEADLAYQMLADPTNTEESALIRVQVLHDMAQRNKNAIFHSEREARTSTPIDIPADPTAPVQPTAPAPPRKRSAFRAPTPRSAASILGGNP